jgi:hypothetical protein
MQHMHVRRVRIEALRCFASAELEFRYPGEPDSTAKLPNVNLIVGDNGGGKTSILRAIALATLAPVISSAGFVPYRLVRRTREGVEKSARVEVDVVLHDQDGVRARKQAAERTTATVIERITDVELVRPEGATSEGWEGMFDDKSPAFLIVGYGASRRVEAATTFDTSVRNRQRQLRYQRVSGLFEEGVTLIPLQAWLPQMQLSNRARYRQVVDLIDMLLPEECEFRGDQDESGEYLFEMRGLPVPFGALSDGYHAYIGWIADLLYHVTIGAPGIAKLVDNSGIVLIDEIDLHLHPEWQRSVVPKLAAALPNLQFILTSHSPIVAGTLQAANIYLTEPTEGAASTVRQIEERIHGLSAEQILLGSYFNLSSTRAADMQDELAKLADRAHEGDANAALEYLHRLSYGSASERTGGRPGKSV